jgi:hypothetical protein
MADWINCAKCGLWNVMYAKCDKCEVKICLQCFLGGAEAAACSSCRATWAVEPLPQE